jgi:hypothetical protein
MLRFQAINKVLTHADIYIKNCASLCSTVKHSPSEKMENAASLVSKIIATMAGIALGLRKNFAHHELPSIELRWVVNHLSDFYRKTDIPSQVLEELKEPLKKEFISPEGGSLYGRLDTFRKSGQPNPWAFVLLDNSFLEKHVKLNPDGESTLSTIELSALLANSQFAILNALVKRSS